MDVLRQLRPHVVMDIENAKNEERTMKTTKNDATYAIKKALGGRRIDRVSWKTLARVYYAARPGSLIRKAINAEARRCGYPDATPQPARPDLPGDARRANGRA